MAQVTGESNQSQDPGVNGENGFSPQFENARTMGPGYGVRGHTSNGYAGVYGEGGENGVFGLSRDDKGSGVFGRNEAGGKGVAGDSTSGTGVAGFSKTWQGVYGSSDSQAGVVGESNGFDGVWGISHSPEHAGVSGHNDKGGYAGYFDGNVTVTATLTVADDIVLSGQDCAEDFSVREGPLPEPGTVMVIESQGCVAECRDAYDTRVAGVISGAGDVRPGLILGRQAGEVRRAPLAMIGKVYCKVDATLAPISVGDLLTTSPTPGHAMKASDRTKAFGAIIGKALGPLPEGRGLVPILVAMQ